jgi:zinc protease
MKLRSPTLWMASTLVACAPRLAQPTSVAPTPSASAPSAAPPVPADESFRAHAPEAAPERPFVVPAATHAELRNHIPVIVVPFPSPYVAIRVVAAGTMSDTIGHVETMFEMARAMGVATTKQSADDLQDLYVSLVMPAPHIFVAPDGVMISLVAPIANLSAVADLAADIAFHPSFDKKSFDWMRDQDVRGRTIESTDAVLSARHTLRRELFAPYPYGITVGGASEVRAVTRGDVVALHRRIFDPSRVSIVVAGGVPADDAVAALEAAFGAQPAHAKRRVNDASMAPLPKGARLSVVDTPGAPVATIMTGALSPPLGIDADAARYAVGMLTNGTFGRLTARLRDELHDVPWITGEYIPFATSCQLGWRTRVATAQVAAVLTETDHIVRQFATDGPRESELADARAGDSLSVAHSFESASDIAGTYAAAVEIGQPISFLTEAPARVAALTVDSVKAAAARYFDAEKMRTVVVGDWAALKEPLLALGWGPIEIHDADGRLLRTEGVPGAKH